MISIEKTIKAASFRRRRQSERQFHIFLRKKRAKRKAVPAPVKNWRKIRGVYRIRAKSLTIDPADKSPTCRRFSDMSEINLSRDETACFRYWTIRVEVDQKQATPPVSGCRPGNTQPGLLYEISRPLPGGSAILSPEEEPS
jgi:hypothetical protein